MKLFFNSAIALLLPILCCANPSGLASEFCDTRPDTVASTDYPVPWVGSVHALWIICSCSHDAVDSSQGRECGNLIYPYTYAMPDWAEWMFDPDDATSLSKYFLDISNGQHVLTGDIIGQGNGSVIVSNIYPWHPACTNNGGSDFFDDVMARVDNMIDFNNYNENGASGDTVVDFVFFNIYGFCDGIDTCYGTEGVSGIANWYESDDTLANGKHIWVMDGVSFWSPAVEAYPSDADNAFWGAHGVAAHEYGHSLRLDHWRAGENPTGNLDSSTHSAFGSFDVMCNQAFGEPALPGRWGPTSPFVPFARVQREWAVSQSVQYPVWNQALDDFTEMGDLISIPVMYAGVTGQYFHVQAATRSSLWERSWPNTGVLIYHVNEVSGFQDNRKKKRVDPELSSGLWDWTMYLDSIPPAWNSDVIQAYAAENNFVRNTVTGSDSFDFKWAHIGPYLSGMFPTERYGSSGNYFFTNDVFSDTSNPSSRAYADTLQSIPSMIHVKVNLVDSANGRCYVTAWNRHWKGTIPEDAYWTDSVVVDSSMVISAGTTLTILPGTKVVLDSGVTITVNGVLNAVGLANSHTVFKEKDTGEKWKQLKVASGGRLTLDYCDFSGFSHYAIYTDTPAGTGTPVSINHCTIDGSNMISGGVALLLWNSPTLVQEVKHTTIQNVPNGATGMYLYNCKVAFDSVNIWNCSYVNSYIKKVTGTFAHCSFYGRTSYYAVLFNTVPTTPNFKCCSFVSIAPQDGSWPSSVFCGTGTSPSFGGQGLYEGVSNVFDDSCKYLMIMQGTAALPMIDRPNNVVGDGGRNDWYQERADGKYIEWRSAPANPSVPYLCEDQFWGSTPDTLDFEPQHPQWWNFDPWQTSAWTLCGGSEGGGGSSIGDDGLAGRGGQGLDDEPDLELLFAAACDHEEAGSYADAQAQFRAVLYGTENPALLWNALAHIITTDAFLSSGESWIPRLVDSLITASGSEYNTRVFAKRLMASYRLNRAEYQAGIDTCVSLLNSGLTKVDSVYVASDLLGIQMAAGVIDGGSLDGERVVIPEGLRVAGVHACIQRERELFDLISGFPVQKSAPKVPFDFSLSQNYPNPFNPTTEISYTLPATTRAELTVYDITGREVAELFNNTQTAGTHTVHFDAHALSSGLYFYRLSAGDYSSTKKMVLLK